MNKSISLTISFMLVSCFSYGQNSSSDFVKSGSPVLKVFANYHSNLDDISKMEIKRSYFGYNYNLSKSYSVKVVFDVCENNGNYSSFLKIAQLKYKKDRIKVEMGMISTKQFKVQERFWGYRYLLKSFQDEYGFNASADIGISVNYKLSDKLLVDAIIQNGEGYKHVEPTQTYRGGFGITYFPIKPLTLRLYYDKSDKPAISRKNIAAFVGYKYKKKFRIGAEYNLQLNHDFIDAKDYSGISLYSTYVINSNFELFARYDDLSLSKLEGDAYVLNKYEDGRTIISGLQYSPVSGVHVSVNYRGFCARSDSEGIESMFYLNFEYSIK